ncbi:peptidoglycan recognition protein [Antribacter sp. KLBMP9083]|uniref:Peptidoglycan recognition protein n=1 Tax=Antribacter soli TaxID=2910976 RepID=A0AA41U6B0_9MICO|nr:peptidoglycan recognition protein [Antribacter soli]MCF4120120.1 peptidoglycan recognition protein [Antribacter soli]
MSRVRALPFRALSAAVAAVLVTGVLAPATGAPMTPSGPSASVATEAEGPRTTSVVLQDDGPQTLVQGPAAQEGDVRLTASAAVTGFATVGVTWTGDNLAAPAVEVRTMDGAGTWGLWTALEVEPGPGGEGGTDPLVVGEVSRVEAVVSGSGASSLGEVRLTVVDPGRRAADAQVTTPPPSIAPGGRSTPIASSLVTGWPGGVGAPSFYNREQWGADESIMTWRPAQGDIKGGVIHHTAGTNDYTPQDVPAILRGIYTYHAQTRDWGDIGYNFLVDKYGNIWEGRAGGIELETIGAHASGYNRNTVGVSVMGNTSTATVTNEAVDAVVRLLAWKLSLHGVDAAATTTLNGNTLPTIFGHRDVASTSCPGNTLWSRQDEIRRRVKAAQAEYGAIRGQGTGAFVMSPWQSDVYLVSGTTKHRVPSMSLLTSLAPLGRVSDAPGVYLSYLSTGPDAGRFVRDPRDGAISLVDAGTRYHAETCAMIARYGATCTEWVGLTGSGWDSLRGGPSLTELLKAPDSDAVYVVRDGKRHHVSSWQRLVALYGGKIPPITVLTSAAVGEIPEGSPA